MNDVAKKSFYNFLKCLSFLYLCMLSHPGKAQNLHQKWIAFLDGNIGELEFRQDSSILNIRSIQAMNPRVYRGEIRKFRYTILSQDSQKIRILLQKYPDKEYGLMQLYEWQAGQMRMYIHARLKSAQVADTIKPPSAWGTRIYSPKRIAEILKGKKPGLMSQKDFVRLLKATRKSILFLGQDSIPPAYQHERELYFGTRFYDAIVDQGYNIFETEEGMDKVLEKYRNAPKVKPLFQEVFELILGKKLE